MPAKGKVEKLFWFFLAESHCLLKRKKRMLTVFVNSQSMSLSPGSNLSDVLNASGLTSQTGIAVAVNNEVVPRTGWNARPLSDMDKITIIKATQGG